MPPLKQKRSRKSTSLISSDPEAPTKSEWDKMPPFKTFKVEDEDGEEHPFSLGNDAMVLPQHFEPGSRIKPHEYWVAKIKDIRSRGDEVWVMVQWYYSGQDAASLIRTFDPKTCGKYERMYSDQQDLISSLAFESVVVVNNFRESKIDSFISRTQFFTRFNLEHKRRAILPKVGDGTCICDAPYKPDDFSGLMHFCPRPSCRQAYHQICLVRAESKETARGRKHRLLLCSPDTDKEFSLEALIKERVSTPAKKRRSSGGKRAISATSPTSVLASLPAKLVELAMQPMVRGAAFPEGGVTGNISYVAHARRLVYSGMTDTDPIPDDWEDEVNQHATIVTMEDIPPLVCPKCKSAI
ncbi:hypothetical protein BDN72DRAFT_960887 [Pluteus cervinus]|uniref:Uncharacterized protein n=1 Tax=Pluteus cervinus TaxID=181527 RepID=A0ACD3AQR7_9AGAR|nr:hypothetical protein BDN72DRAFT_960887 [Pluteus cervinus]